MRPRAGLCTIWGFWHLLGVLDHVPCSMGESEQRAWHQESNTQSRAAVIVVTCIRMVSSVSAGLGAELFDQTPILVPLCRDFVEGINTDHQVSLRRLFRESLVELL